MPETQTNLPPNTAPQTRPSRIPSSLLRCAASSLASVALEFVLLTICVSVFHMHYLSGAIVATCAYLCINFVINRLWAFRAAAVASVSNVRKQLARHIGVAAVGAGLGIALLRFFVHTIGLPYQLGWMASGCIGFGTWTYPMSRLFTFATD